MTDILDITAKRLGYAGLIPPALLLGVFAYDPSLRWIILSAGFGYAAFIFTFLGGVWWGLAMGGRAAPSWLWIAAVAPSLIAFALFMPWTFGWRWPGPEMLILSALILCSPLVDRAMAATIALPPGWLRLRSRLSLWLALMTFLLSWL